MIILTTSIPKLFGADAMSIAPFILITKQYRNNAALLEHEKTHCKEQLPQLVIFWWLQYLLSKNFRLAAEVRAYKVQIKMGGISVQDAAWLIANKYNLNITEAAAAELLNQNNLKG